jgi:hypothetical protein
MPKSKILNIALKKTLIISLHKRAIFWSYSIDEDMLGEFSDDILIEHTLLYGKEADIEQLFCIYKKSLIRSVWEKQVVPDTRFKGVNFYLALFWFHIPYARINFFLDNIANQNNRESRFARTPA